VATGAAPVGAVDDIMTRKPYVAAPDDLAAAILRTMNDRKITQVFVVDGARPVGLLHMHDFLRAGVV
jgi:arabinose-5-phosphate isomerase